MMRPRRTDGRSGVRIRSPPALSVKIRDHRQSDWRSNSYRNEYLSPPRESEKQSRSVLNDCVRRSPVEGRDFAWHLDGGRGKASRVHFRRFDEAWPHQESTPIELRHKYFDFDREGDPNSKQISGLDAIGGGSPSRRGKDKDFQGNGTGLDGQGMLLEKSMCLEDGSVRTFFSLPPDAGSALSTRGFRSSKVGKSNAFGSSSGVNLNIGCRDDDDLRYPNRMLIREPYDDEEEKQRMFYSRDVSYPMIPPSASHSKSFGGVSSSLVKDDIRSSYRDCLHLPSVGGLGGSNGDKFTEPLEGYDQAQQFFDPTKGPELQLKDLKSYQQDLISPARGEPRDCNYSELRQRYRDDLPFLPDELYKKMPPNARNDNYSREMIGTSFIDRTGDRIDDAEASHRMLLRDNGTLWDRHYLQEDPVTNYHDVNRLPPLARDQHGEIFGSVSRHLEFGRKVSQDCDITHFGGDYGLGRDVGKVDYRERLKNPLMSEHDQDVFRFDVNHWWPQHSLNEKELDIYDTSEMAAKRNYLIDEMDRQNKRSVLPNNHNISRQILERSGLDERGSSEDRVRALSSKRLGSGHPRKSGRFADISHGISISDDSMPSQQPPVRVGSSLSGSRHLSLKRRLKFGHSDFYSSVSFDKRQGYYRPYRIRKAVFEDKHGRVSLNDGDNIEDTVPLGKKADPSEGSEEFKQQVHRAFLRFSKQLNESPAQQKKYREQGKAGGLRCSVCGSLSKEYGDTHSLIAHAFNSLKVGLRTSHLGLHKAICVMMGWNSLIAPDTVEAYLFLPVAEASAMKEDLILWPPLVIIHNSSIGKKSTDTQVVVTNERMEEILRGMGFSTGKVKVCRGKPANHSILVVKFLPTFSGLQEAERLHKHYAENKRGRQELQQVASKDSGNGRNGEHINNADDLLLYGYMGIAEDLDKLDFETKKRCVVKSMKDIEAIADASLTAD